MRFRKYISAFIFLFVGALSSAQELPPIEVFMPEVYGAEDQNWAIDQGSDQTIYFANNKGLLAYNGARWQLHESSNSSIKRSVKVIQDKIYTGSYMDFGYWEKDDYGNLKYTSIVDQLKVDLLEDEEFWSILELEQWIIFQSLDRIYIYNTKDQTFSIINSETTIIKAYKVDNTIYFQKINQGIYKIESGKEVLVTDDRQLKDQVVVNIFMDNGQLLIQTKEKGFFVLNNNTVTSWDINLNRQLAQFSIYNSIRLKNGGYLLGTVSHGVLLIDATKRITQQIDQSTGLGNNTVLSLFEDKKRNVWLGSDHGINNINFNAPFRVYKDYLGILGTVYTTLMDDNILYLGTNQGLFYKDYTQKGTFNFVKGTEGQVWTLQKLKNTIFCGHDKGTFVIKNGVADQISDVAGTWQIKELENLPTLLIQGNYNGLYILENRNSRWRLKNKLDNYNMSSRYIEFVKPNELLVSHEHKGVYKLVLDNNFENVISHTRVEVDKAIKSSLTTFNNRVLYGSDQGVFYYNTALNTFVKDNTFSQLYNPKDYSSGRLVNTNDRLFTFTNRSITYAERGKLSSNYQLLDLPLSNSIRETKDGYENILYVGNDKYLIGTTGGYIITELNTKNQEDYRISIDAITAHILNVDPKKLNLSEEPLLENKENHLNFSFNVTDYSKYLPSLYQYRLLNFNENWSDWSTSPDAVFENLPHGEFTFEVRAKVGDTVTSNIASYNFTIEKPWYLKPSAIVIYFASGFFFVVLVHMIYRGYYKNQRKKLLQQKEKELEIKQLENEQQLMHFKNLELEKDIEAKNRELGMSAMNLIKRNELLSTIKKELGNTKNLDDISKVVKMINRNLNTTDDWKIFEEAFNNTDKDFIKKLKEQHPNLTSNDLRLCTYLRLNLSSKEIAPLLNISIRSVEVKRYRLRKKMNLPHEESLSSYILHM
ncbi:helix-turn-helix and ligand-binding sensor domain-containing protein [Pseudotenacibaculum haliotis]|uniref:Triple tyrosine motif-containing protein n=1 Tax=Pseudotenacibaculum haliotis TaxID=1862138 RepID=A0ABW5LQM0_9FLAO